MSSCGAEPLALQVGGDGEPAERRLRALDEHPDRADEAVPVPAAERDDAVARRRSASSSSRVCVSGGMCGSPYCWASRDERRAAQREQLTGVVDGHRTDLEVGLRHAAHRVSRSARDHYSRTLVSPDSLDSHPLGPDPLLPGPARDRARRRRAARRARRATSPSRSSSATRCRGCSSCGSRSPSADAARRARGRARGRSPQQFAMDWSLDVVGPAGAHARHGVDRGALPATTSRSASGPRTCRSSIVAVVSNHTVLEPLAEFYGIPFHHVPVTAATKAARRGPAARAGRASSTSSSSCWRATCRSCPTTCAARSQGRVINIHHSFLPSFKGARPYAQAHDRGRQAHRRDRALRDRRPRRGPDHRAGRRARRPLAARRGPGRARAGRRAPRAGPGRALARRAPGAARRAPHDRLPLKRFAP